MAKLTFYYAPQTRASGVLTLLEELGATCPADYELAVLDLKRGEQRQPPYLAVNPMGKVPALRHGEHVITEQAAVYTYLADLFPQAGLAPAPGTLDAPTLRGPYLRWMAFYGASFEPAVVDRSLARDDPQRKLAPPSTSPYGDFDTMLNTLDDQLARGPWLLGDTFTAADVLWGAALAWTTMFGLVPATRSIQGYLDRYRARPAVQRAAAREAELLAARGA